MRYTEYEERNRRKKIIDSEYAWFDDCFHPLIAWPLIVDINPGETVVPSSWQTMKAPEFGNAYELWHYVCNGLHICYRFVEV